MAVNPGLDVVLGSRDAGQPRVGPEPGGIHHDSNSRPFCRQILGLDETVFILCGREPRPGAQLC